MKRTVLVTVVAGILFGYAFSRARPAIATRTLASAAEPSGVLSRPAVQRATEAPKTPAKAERSAKSLTVLLGDSSAGSSDEDGPAELDAGRNTELEAILDHAPEETAWTKRVKASIQDAIADDPEVQLRSVRCVSEFCGVQISKPVNSKLDWPEIDDRLTFIDGEKIFRAGSNSKETTAYVYFSAREGGLPLSVLHPESADEGD